MDVAGSGQGPIVSGGTHTLERSADLATWSPAADLAPVVTAPDADGDGLVEKVSVMQPLDPGLRSVFLRVRVMSED